MLEQREHWFLSLKWAVLHRRTGGLQFQLPLKAGESCLCLSTRRAESKKLQPVFGDLVSRFTSNGIDKGLEVITFEASGFAALSAKKEMLMSCGRRDERLASL